MSAAQATSTDEAVARDKITCQICSERVHVMHSHLAKTHPGVSIEQYQTDFPDAPMLSELALSRWQQKQGESTDSAEPQAKQKPKLTVVVDNKGVVPAHELLGVAEPILRGDGKQMTFRKPDADAWTESHPAVTAPEPDPHYVWQTEPTRYALAALNTGIPGYAWGHTGTGKTSLFNEIAARAKWPLVRMNHNKFTEPYQIVGSKEADENGTYFSPGPLALAVRYGAIYIADELGWASSECNGIYQSILEGKPLVIGDAPADSEWRVVEPHKNFRFVATDNTNGSGDETDLYDGTSQQNFAAMSRYITFKVEYMPREAEAKMIAAKALITHEEAHKLVDFATRIRQAYEEQRLSAPIGPRELILGATIGKEVGDVFSGLNVSYMGKLPSACAHTAGEVAQRIFGE